MSQYFKTSAFQKVIEEIETFSLEDQEILLDILNKRLAEQKRSQLLKDVAEARLEYRMGNFQLGTVDEFLAALDEEE
ncbi:hypothetical protein PMG71_05915 [Roseofilum sp. BLCC_M154]|uniref:CopG family transcriptional regulator n=1 Tax=Roseofilum acuticapitatum BLCC-M154 TaxID=3022444 RepID=A0ABT7AQ01_9CYAN|nr:hypothetical protein [Roseofilum acuticapitatum]MDJ1168956.1 hypothetical protein [Roseofilum acuticapitatum BLCC-M154]